MAVETVLGNVFYDHNSTCIFPWALIICRDGWLLNTRKYFQSMEQNTPKPSLLNCCCWHSPLCIVYLTSSFFFLSTTAANHCGISWLQHLLSCIPKITFSTRVSKIFAFVWNTIYCAFWQRSHFLIKIMLTSLIAGGHIQHARQEKKIALEEYYKNHNITPHH